MLRHIALALTIAASPLLAQDRADDAAIAKLKELETSQGKVMEIASWLTDVYGPRLTGSPMAKKAADWAIAQFKEWGLANPHLEKWGPFGRGWSNDRFVAQAVSPKSFPIIGYASAWTPGTTGAVRGEVVLIPNANAPADSSYLQYKGKLKGKIVFVDTLRDVKPHLAADARRLTDEQLAEMANAPAPGAQGTRSGPNPQMMERFRAMQDAARARAAFFAAEGAIALVSASRGDDGTVFTNNGGSRDAATPTPIPQLFFAAEHYGEIVRMLDKHVRVTLDLDVKNTFYDDDPSSFNVVAEIPGTDPALKDEVVMLGAHFDSWHAATGATDNAAGSAVMMEAIRLIKASGMQPRRTIRIALWTGEEQGLLGSRAYVKEHFGDPQTQAMKPDNEKVSGYFNLDNGTGAIRGVYLQGNTAVAPTFDAWMKPFAPRMHTLTPSNTGGTDHLAFDAVGIPGFQFIQDPIDYDTRTHHSNMDTFERLQPDDMTHNATVVAAFVWQTAQREQKLPRKVKTTS